jgi:hypothetical protein
LQQAGIYKEEFRVADPYEPILVAGSGSVPIWHQDQNPGVKTVLYGISKNNHKNIKYFDIFLMRKTFYQKGLLEIIQNQRQFFKYFFCKMHSSEPQDPDPSLYRMLDPDP